MTDLRPQKAEEHLARILGDTREKLLAMGCAEAVVAEQIDALDAAIRDRYGWLRAAQTGGGAA